MFHPCQEGVVYHRIRRCGPNYADVLIQHSNVEVLKVLADRSCALWEAELYGKLFVCMKTAGRAQQPIGSRSTGWMHPIDILENEARRFGLWEVNGVYHARRIVARLQHVANGKPSVSDRLLLGVP